jgi:predicted transposase/invertase (TIGR01784 family)
MRVNGKHVDLEVQVENENDYPERSLYYWARDYSTALQEGGTYLELPDVIIISILDFRLFDCETHYSRFQVFEETRHELLATKLDLRYYELVKLSKAS